MAEVISVGALNTDYVMRGPALPRPGETVSGGVFYRSLGGKAANAAIAAARAGARDVSLISAVGDDLIGVEAIKSLTDAGIASRFVWKIPDEKSGVALIMVDDCGENAISVTDGAARGIKPQHIEEIPGSMFDAAKILLVNFELEIRTLLALLSKAKSHNITTVLDPAPFDDGMLSPEVLASVTIVTPNQTEAAQLSGLPTSNPQQCLHAARKLRDMGCATVALTMGGDGCLLLQDEAWLAPPRQVEAVDTTAAGDAFNGVLACALASGRKLHEAVRFASAAASISVTRIGASASLPTAEETDAVYEATPALRPFDP